MIVAMSASSRPSPGARPTAVRISPDAVVDPTLAGLIALNGLATAIVVVDDRLCVLLANAAAETLFASDSAVRIVHEGLDRSCARRVLVAARRQDGIRLGTLVLATAQGASVGGAVRLRDDAFEMAFAAIVTPLHERASSEEGVRRLGGQALIVLRGLTPSRPPGANLLRDLFGLTPAEAAVARALYGGATKAAVAAQRGVRASTICTHVDGILAKTGATNLRDLERLLASLG